MVGKQSQSTVTDVIGQVLSHFGKKLTPFRFFCALHPDMRKSWAEAWHCHLKPGGFLITLQFPLEPDGREGPPWPVQKEAYEKVLLPVGFECTRYERVTEADATREDRAGREAIAVWRRK
jgi:hypothetical protein